MRLGKILGTVVSTAKHPKYHSLKLYVVQPVDGYMNPSGESFLAVDTVQSGVGDLVLTITEGNGARQIFKEKVLPIRSVIVGVVDEVDMVQGRPLRLPD
jgi:ethanolamine utilization protein EutN